MKCDPAEWECLDGVELQIIPNTNFSQETPTEEKDTGNKVDTFYFFAGREKLYFDGYSRKRENMQLPMDMDIAAELLSVSD